MKTKSLINYLRHLTKISNFEYFVFKLDGERISTDFTPEEAERIFEVICTLPFPLNTNPLNAKKIKALMAGVTFDLYSDEKRAIEAVLKNISPNLFVLPVPKSLAQFYGSLAIFFALVNADENSPEDLRLEQHEQSFYEVISNHMVSLLKQQYGDNYQQKIHGDIGGRILSLIQVPGYTTDPSRFVQDNNRFAQLWLGLNKTVVTEVINYEIPDLQQCYKQFAKKLCTKYALEQTPAFRFIDPSHSDLILSLLDAEIDIMFDPNLCNTIALYRGTKNGYLGDIETCELAADPESISWSFGNGLFESAISACGDCAMAHIISPAPSHHLKQSLPATGYIVFVDKLKYMSNEQERGLFWIPPYIMLARICAKGELFHPRTAGGLGKGNSNIIANLKSCIEVHDGKQRLNKNSMMSINMFGLLTSTKVDLNRLIIDYLRQHARNLNRIEDKFLLEKNRSKQEKTIPFYKQIYNFIRKTFKKCINFFKDIYNYFTKRPIDKKTSKIITKDDIKQLPDNLFSNPRKTMLLSNESKGIRERSYSFPVTIDDQASIFQPKLKVENFP